MHTRGWPEHVPGGVSGPYQLQAMGAGVGGGSEKGQQESRRAAGKDTQEWCLESRGRAWAEKDGHFSGVHCMPGTDLSTQSLTQSFPKSVLRCYCYHHPHLTDGISEAQRHQAIGQYQARIEIQMVQLPWTQPLLPPHPALQRPQGHGCGWGNKAGVQLGSGDWRGDKPSRDPERPRTRKVARDQEERQKDPPARKGPSRLSTS